MMLSAPISICFSWDSSWNVSLLEYKTVNVIFLISFIDIYYKFGMLARFGNYLVPLLILLQLLIEVMSQNNTEVNATLNAQKKATVFKYFIFSEKCYNTLVIDRNFAHFECIKFVLFEFNLDSFENSELRDCRRGSRRQSAPNYKNHQQQEHQRSVILKRRTGRNQLYCCICLQHLQRQPFQHLWLDLADRLSNVAHSSFVCGFW